MQNSFYYPKRGEEIINKLTGIFVPRGFDPVSDRIMQGVRPGNPVIYSLRTAGLRSDITYKIIMTTNPGDGNGFFPWFDGKTWEIADDGCYRATINGDGVVHYRESVLPGISLDIIPVPSEQGDHFPAPYQYCHINLPKNPLVIKQIMQYLTGPAGTK